MLSERLRDLEARRPRRAHRDPVEPAHRRVSPDRARPAARPDHRRDARLRRRTGLAACGPERRAAPVAAALSRQSISELAPTSWPPGQLCAWISSCCLRGLRMPRGADQPAERDERRGDRHAEVEAVQRGAFGSDRHGVCLRRGHAVDVRASQRQALGCGDRRAGRAAERRARQAAVHRGGERRGDRRADRRRAEQPATRAIALLTPEAMPASSPSRRAPPPSAARPSSTGRARRSTAAAALRRRSRPSRRRLEQQQARRARSAGRRP